MMSSSSPRYSDTLSSGAGMNDSDVNSAYGSSPKMRTYPQPMATMAITDLVISEGHHLTTLNRIAYALNQAVETSVTVGRKESTTVRSLVDRWAEMVQIHSKFHEDVVAVIEDLREAAELINEL
ncbi:hypothetical protein BGZ54_004489, partial [Gamsiella multidivaricata]